MSINTGSQFIMDVAGYAFSFFFHCMSQLKLGQFLLQAAMRDVSRGARDYSDGQERRNREEPPRLPYVRLQIQLDRLPRLIPYAVIVAGFDFETVMTGRKVVVFSDAVVTGIHPIPIRPDQTIAVMIFVRRAIAQRHELNLQIAAAGRNPYRIRSFSLHFCQ